MWAPTYQRPDSLIKRGRESWNFAALAATMLFAWRLQQSECRRTRNKNHTREAVRNPEDRALPSMRSYSSHPSIAFSLLLRPQWRSSCSQEYLCLCDGVAAQLRNWHQPMPLDFFLLLQLPTWFWTRTLATFLHSPHSQWGWLPQEPRLLEGGIQRILPKDWLLRATSSLPIIVRWS